MTISKKLVKVLILAIAICIASFFTSCHYVVPVAFLADGRLLYSYSVVTFTDNVTYEQKKLIRESINLWTKATNGGVSYDEVPNSSITFDAYNNKRFLNRCMPVIQYDVVKKDDVRVVEFEKETKINTKNNTLNTLALTIRNDCSVTQILLVADKITADSIFVDVSAHEFGHALGLGHVDDPMSLMNEIHSDATQGCVTRDDAVELCEHIMCFVNDIKYCD